MPHTEYSPLELDKIYPGLGTVEDLDLPDLSRLEDNKLYAAGMTVVQEILREMNQIGTTRRQGGVSEVNEPPKAKEDVRSGRSEEELREDRSGFGRAGARSGVSTIIENLEVCALGEHGSNILYPLRAHNAQACHMSWHLPPCDKRSVVAVDASPALVQGLVFPESAKVSLAAGPPEAEEGSSRDNAPCVWRDCNERVFCQFPRLCSDDAVPSGALYSKSHGAARPGRAEGGIGARFV